MADFCDCDEPDLSPTAMANQDLTWMPTCARCHLPWESGKQEIVRLSTDGSEGALFLAIAVNAVMGLNEAKDMERLGALADMVGALGRRLGEELAEATPS